MNLDQAIAVRAAQLAGKSVERALLAQAIEVIRSMPKPDTKQLRGKYKLKVVEPVASVVTLVVDGLVRACMRHTIRERQLELVRKVAERAGYASGVKIGSDLGNLIPELRGKGLVSKDKTRV